MDLWNNRNWTPMLLAETNKPFDDKDYIFEIKFDGIRAIIFVSPTHFEIRNRHNKIITEKYPELESIKNLVKKETILDGEIVMMENGIPSFSSLQTRAHLKNRIKIKNASIKNPVVFVCFDILYYEKDLIDLTLIKRKKVLNQIEENDVLVKTKPVDTCGTNLYQSTKKLKLEGIVAKNKKSTYDVNTRTNSWIKIKHLKVEEFIVGGYRENIENSISLMLGEYRNNKLYYVGSVVLNKKREFYKKIIKQRIKNKSPFIDYESNSVKYIEPTLKCNIEYLERTNNNHLRHPVYREK